MKANLDNTDWLFFILFFLIGIKVGLLLSTQFDTKCKYDDELVLIMAEHAYLNGCVNALEGRDLDSAWASISKEYVIQK